MHARIPKGNMGYDQYTIPDTVAVEPDTRKHTTMASRAILTHNTFRDCRVHFFRQPFSK